MDIIQTAILGIVQGATELLPISSSGHLILLSNLVFSKDISTLLLTSLHLGSTLAILFAYKEFFFKSLRNRTKIRTLIYIVIATIPAALLGIFFEDKIERYLHGNYIIAVMLILVGVLMIVFEKTFIKPTIKKWEDISLAKSILIGLGQSLALIPGTSRSGSTTLVAMALGVEKYKAIEYSFILGTPILLGSFIYSVSSTPNAIEQIFTKEVIIGIFLSALTGYLAITILKKYSKKNFLTFFGIYRVIVGTLLLLTLL